MTPEARQQLSAVDELVDVLELNPKKRGEQLTVSLDVPTLADRPESVKPADPRMARLEEAEFRRYSEGQERLWTHTRVKDTHGKNVDLPLEPVPVAA